MLCAAARAWLSRSATVGSAPGGAGGGGVEGTDSVLESAQSGDPDALGRPGAATVEVVDTGVAAALVGTHVPQEFELPAGRQLVPGEGGCGGLGSREFAQGSFALRGSVCSAVMKDISPISIWVKRPARGPSANGLPPVSDHCPPLVTVVTVVKVGAAGAPPPPPPWGHFAAKWSSAPQMRHFMICPSLPLGFLPRPCPLPEVRA